MAMPHSDALVFFGATGDLAYKQIFPALHSMVRHGHLDMPVIGVAKAGWSLDQLKARALDSVNKQGDLDADAFAKLSARLQYIDRDCAVDGRTGSQVGHYAPLPGHYLVIFLSGCLPLQ